MSASEGGLVPRLATPEDFEEILRLSAERTRPARTCGDSGGFGPEFLRGLTGSASEHDLFVAERCGKPAGYLVMRRLLVRDMTGDREAIVEDFVAPEPSQRQALFDCAARAARRHQARYLTISVEADDSGAGDFLVSQGFGLESYRISVGTADCRVPEGSPYEVRRTVPEDGFLISVLNSTMIAHTLSAGRDYDMAELTFRSMGAIMAQVGREDPGNLGLVLTLGGEMVGHLLIEVEERFGYIYDLALEREHWGGLAVRHLMRTGSRLLFERGVPLFVGDVSAANRRALLVAQRALGFQVDSLRYGQHL